MNLSSKSLPYLVIIILSIILFLKNCSDKPKETAQKPKIDTVIVEKVVHDTIPGKLILVKQEIDTTIWQKKSENIPDTTYEGLLKQYTAIGNKLFTKKFYSTKFKIKDYGFITVNDSIKENSLIFSDIITDLTIPTSFITVQKPIPPKRELYFGPQIFGNSIHPIKQVSLSGLLKDKKDHIYNFSVGYDGELIFGGGIFYKIKFK